jgi:hypothetical protein
MSDQVKNNQQTVVIALVVIAALLVAIVGVLVVQGQSANIPAISNNQGAPAGGDPAAGGMPGGAPGGMPGGGVPSVEFDPATATKVPAGVEPEAFIRDYYAACSEKKYEDAFTMLPLATQQYYGDAAQFEATLESYGISGFEVKSASGSDTEVQVVGVQQAQGMSFAYTWTLVKEGDDWFVKSREMGGE